MKPAAYAIAAALALAGGAAIAAAASVPPAALTAAAPHIVAAVSDTARPAADTARDAHRKPAEMLAFADVRPGQKIAEMLPGGGYFTRIFSKAVGPTGKLYTVEAPAANAPRVAALVQPYGNIVPVVEPLASFSVPEPVDLVWTSLNYHDLRNNPATDMLAINRRAFAALKPGGLYIVIDHSAVAGTTTEAARSLHRIDEGLVRRDVEAAGFTFVGESNAIRNPADPRTVAVRDGDVAGRTDQFVLKFRKP